MTDDCLACHCASVVPDQPAESEETWQRIAGKLRTDHHAQIAGSDMAAIVTWLAGQKGEH